MRFLSLSVIILLASGGAWAQESADDSALASKDLWTRQRLCKLIGDLSVTIMKERQKEVPMSEMISRLQAFSAMAGKDGTGITNELVVAMVMAAYKQPAFSNAELQQSVIGAFRNDVELQCFEGRLTSAP